MFTPTKLSLKYKYSFCAHSSSFCAVKRSGRHQHTPTPTPARCHQQGAASTTLEDTASSTRPTGRRQQDAASTTPPAGCRQQGAASRTLAERRQPEASSTLPARRRQHDAASTTPPARRQRRHVPVARGEEVAGVRDARFARAVAGQLGPAVSLLLLPVPATETRAECGSQHVSGCGSGTWSQ